MKKINFIFLLFWISCAQNIKRENDADDIKLATEVCENYLKYYNIDLKKSFEYCAKIPFEEYSRYKYKADSMHGKIIEHNYIQGQSLYEKTSKSLSGEYIIQYSVKRERKETSLIIYLELIDGKIKIISSEENFKI